MGPAALLRSGRRGRTFSAELRPELDQRDYTRLDDLLHADTGFDESPVLLGWSALVAPLVRDPPDGCGPLRAARQAPRG